MSPALLCRLAGVNNVGTLTTDQFKSLFYTSQDAQAIFKDYIQAVSVGLARQHTAGSAASAVAARKHFQPSLNVRHLRPWSPKPYGTPPPAVGVSTWPSKGQ
jgi:hypothetical protein